MKKGSLTLSVTFLVVFCVTGLQAQEALLAAGGNTTGRNGGSVSYSVGQVFYTTNNYVFGTFAHGVQQPYEISVIPQNECPECLNPLVYVFPNPATDYLQLWVESDTLTEYFYELTSISGRLLEGRKIEGNYTRIELNQLNPSVYLLSVIANNQKIKTFKIIKK